MRCFALLVMIGCHAGSTPRAPAEVQQCPLRWTGAVPEIARAASLAEAAPLLAASPSQATEDLPELVAERGPALFANVMFGAQHGSDAYLYYVMGVFVMPDHVVVAKRVATWMSVPPPSGTKAPRDVSAIEILDGGASGPKHVGHLRIVRGTTIVDHFIDLDAGEYLVGLDEGAIATTGWTITEDGPTASGCLWRWDEH